MDDAAAVRTSIATWVVVTAFCLSAIGMFEAAGFRFGPGGTKLPMLFLSGGLITLPLMVRQRSRRLGLAVAALLQVTVVSGSAMILTYAAAAVARPLVDAPLLAMDRTLGFDWPRYAGFVAGHRSIGRVLGACYSSLFCWPPIVVAALTMARSPARMQRYVWATLLTLIITILLFAAFPVTTAWVHLNVPDQAVRGYRYLPLATSDWIHDLIAVRAGNIRVLSWGEGAGLIGFPSYHAASAVIVTWALWPVTRLRWFTAAISTGLVAATPIYGGHYLVDVIAGVGVASGCILLSGIVCRYAASIDLRSFSMPPVSAAEA